MGKQRGYLQFRLLLRRKGISYSHQHYGWNLEITVQHEGNRYTPVTLQKLRTNLL